MPFLFSRHLFNANAEKYGVIFLRHSWASRRGFRPINEIEHTNNAMEMSPRHRSLTLNSCFSPHARFGDDSSSAACDHMMRSRSSLELRQSIQKQWKLIMGNGKSKRGASVRIEQWMACCTVRYYTEIHYVPSKHLPHCCLASSHSAPGQARTREASKAGRTFSLSADRFS